MFRTAARQVQHRRRADAQLEVAADMAGNPGGLGDVSDLDRRGDAAVLAGIDADHVGRVGTQDVPGVGEREDALVDHDRDTGRRRSEAIASVSPGAIGCSATSRLNGRSRSSAIRAVVTFQPQLASIVIGISGPATSRTALHPREVAGQVEPDLHLQASHAPAQELLGQRPDARQVEGPDHHLGRDDVADLAAQKLIDRHAQRLAGDVPERHLDGGLGERIELDQEIHQLAERRDLGRIGTHQGRPDQVVERRDAALARLAAPERRDGRLAQPDQAVIGMNA